MDNISKKEKDFMVFLLDRRKETEELSLRVKDILFDFLKLENDKIEIEICEDRIFLENCKSQHIDLLLTLLNLLIKLYKKEYIYVYDFQEEKCSNLKDSEGGEVDIIYDCREILQILNSNYCISEKFREFIKKKYKTNEKKDTELNFKIAIIAILISTFVNALIYANNMWSNIWKIINKMKGHLNVTIFFILLIPILIVYYIDFYEKKE